MSYSILPVDHLLSNHRALIKLLNELHVDTVIRINDTIHITYVNNDHHLEVELNNEVSSSADQSDGTHQG